MSGIYIPGMEMPTSCIACRLNFGEKRPEYGLTIYCPYSNVVISWRDKAFDNGRLASCGIVPVPDHGRLIDKDALEKDISESVVFSGRKNNPEIYGANKIINRLHRAPTIIPADKEGE